ncbi:MAG: MFS transporter [Clostridiales bacterium]|nr:MFS transporter [Candidatus Apopatocola equi]
MDNKKPQLTSGIVNSYALANGLNTMAFTVPTLYLNMFMTDYLGINPVALGTGMLIAKTVDFIVGIVAGIIIEKANMKRGKYMSWIRILTATLFFGNIIQMLDTTAFVGNSTARLIIVMIGYMMFHCSMNFNATARAALIPKMAGSDMESRKLITARQGQVAAAVSIIASATILPIVSFVQKTTGQDSLGYFIAALLFSTSFVVCNMIFIKKASVFDPPMAAAEAKKSSPTVKQMVASVVTNKQMLVLFSGYVFFTVGTQLYAGVLTYFFRVTGNFGKYTLAQTARAICAFLTSMVAPKIGKRIGKKNALVVGWLVYAAGALLIWAFGYSSATQTANITVVIIGMCICQSAMYLYTVFMANYYLDCGEYGYATTGVDNRTMAVTVMNWPTKIGFAVGGSLVGYSLAWAGYIAPDAASGTAGSFQYMNRFMMIVGLIPAICIVIGAVIIFTLYKLTDAQASEYAKMNAEREAAAKNA